MMGWLSANGVVRGSWNSYHIRVGAQYDKYWIIRLRAFSDSLFPLIQEIRSPAYNSDLPNGDSVDGSVLQVQLEMVCVLVPHCDSEPELIPPPAPSQSGVA
jgi:hypothetical protein